MYIRIKKCQFCGERRETHRVVIHRNKSRFEDNPFRMYPRKKIILFLCADCRKGLLEKIKQGKDKKPHCQQVEPDGFPQTKFSF